MSLNLKLRTCFITFIVVISSFSFLFINSNTVKADDPFEDGLGEFLQYLLLMKDFFDNILSPHPYRIIGSYYVNETLNITGDIVFSLFFSSTLLTQLEGKYQDKVNISLHHYDIYEGTINQIENANLTITLYPELFEDKVQMANNIKLIDINHTIYKGDYLLISVELIQSKKPISNFIEKRWEKRIKYSIERLITYINYSKNPDISVFGGMLKDFFSLLQEAGIGAEEIANLVNSFSSSSFYYGSASYKSSVFIPISNSEDNKTLYFHYMPSEIDELGMGNIITIDETKPSGDTDFSWPPLLLSTDFESETGGMDWFYWAIIWLIYHLEDLIFKEEDIRTYYLTKDKTLVLNKPTGDSPERIILSKDPIKWEGITLERNKIITNATADLYLHYPRLIVLRKVKINATLYDETEEKIIGTDEKNIDRTTLFELLQRGPDSPTLFTFKDAIEEEIWNGHNISLRISVSQEPLFSLRSSILVCDSVKYPSSITLKLKETDNIKIEELEDKKIIPGGSAEIILNITSKYEDTIDIEVGINHTDNPDDWTIEYTSSVDIAEDDLDSITVFVNSTKNSSDAYGDRIELIFNATGKTGFDQKDSKVIIHTDAVDVDFEVVNPKNKEIKKGEKGKYRFIIRNLNNGFLYDTYQVEATSEHGWNLSYPNMIQNLEPYVLNQTEYILIVTIRVPEDTDVSSDKLEITISSEEARIKNASKIVTVTVTTKVISPNILEMIYNFFESVAEDLGLDEIFGSYAAAFLLFIVVFIILIFLIIVIYLIKRKYIEIVCLDRIKDITPDEEATFDVTLKNPFKRPLTYEINAKMESESNRWGISLDKERVVVDPKQSSVIVLTVKPTDYVKSDDWIEVRVIAKVVEKEKSSEISTIATIIEGKPEVDITGLFHWPRVFKKGDKVETSFRLTNRGNASASNINVILYVNSKEKNKVKDITIPRGGYAEVEIPWIAVKGKNKVDIVVK
jgi:hypothetical protein